MLGLHTTYYQRVRMELDLSGRHFDPKLPDDYFFIPWDEALLFMHAEVHHRSFSDCVDAELFPSFRERNGCYFLLREIRAKPGFLPGATWLIASAAGCCASIQCVAEDGAGSIQNVGVLPGYRGLGLGRALLEQALLSFQTSGLRRAVLEVTGENQPAVELYRSLGFVPVSHSLRAVTSWD